MHVNTPSAKVKPPGSPLKTAIALSLLLPRIFATRIHRAYQSTPFFVSPQGLPSAPVYVLSKEERQRASSA
jgi:hypothetical protein